MKDLLITVVLGIKRKTCMTKCDQQLTSLYNINTVKHSSDENEDNQVGMS